MLAVLHDSLIDSSWPVRDRACIAIARFIRSIWDRQIDVTLPVDIRFIPLPTPDDIMRYDENIGNNNENNGNIKYEPKQNDSEKEEITMLSIMNEVINILFNYLHNDSFRPVRESAAIAIVDCLLPSTLPPSINQFNQFENPLKVLNNIFLSILLLY